MFKKRPWLINVILFLLTACTTTLAGALYTNDTIDSWLWFFLRGTFFSVPIMLILVVHEMGHYLTGRRYRLDVTLPYFIPAVPPLGTFGAFIKIRSLIPNKRVLMEVGAWGPIAGAAVAIPLLMVGLLLSDIRPLTGHADGFSLGSSIILELLCYLVFGQFSMNSEIMLHPTAIAAWFGLFVTAMNLLPIGQLDGGHVVYALFGSRRARVVGLTAYGCLIVLGIFFWVGWLVFGLLVFFLGLKHPPPLDSDTPLGQRGRLLGWVAIVLFVLTFIPVPIQIPDVFGY